MIFNLIGFIGVFLYLLSYFLLSMRKIDGNGSRYLLINLVAAVAVLISLFNSFNAPSAAIQVSWIVLSIYGLIHLYLKSDDKSGYGVIHKAIKLFTVAFRKVSLSKSKPISDQSTKGVVND